jgi:hypothetical protein
LADARLHHDERDCHDACGYEPSIALRCETINRVEKKGLGEHSQILDAITVSFAE